MQTQNLFAIATLTMALTGTVFGQWHPEIDKVKARKANVQSIKSPRDVATGQIKSPREVATGQAARRNAPRATQDKLGNFEIQGVKSPRDVASGQASGIKSPRDVATGQATGKRQHKPLAKHPNGFMDYTDDAAMTQIQPGQNSGGTISNQRRKQSKTNRYENGGVEHEDTWTSVKGTATRKRK